MEATRFENVELASGLGRHSFLLLDLCKLLHAALHRRFTMVDHDVYLHRVSARVGEFLDLLTTVSNAPAKFFSLDWNGGLGCREHRNAIARLAVSVSSARLDARRL